MEVFDKTGSHSRTLRGSVPAQWESATVLDDGNFLVASPNPVPGQHLFGIISKETGNALAAFGGTRLRRRPGAGDHQLATERRLIAYHGGSTFWSVSPIRYELELWTVGGERMAQIRRGVPWFRDRLAEEAGPTGTEELLVGLHLDADDVLWVIAYIPGATEREVAPSLGLRVQPRNSTIRVEAFDARTARLLASEYFENPYDFWVAPIADSRAYRVRYNVDGIMSVELVRYRLARRVD
jgi:hypothetical protein